jgi:hypothetical protein
VGPAGSALHKWACLQCNASSPSLTVLWAAQGWSQLHTHGLLKSVQVQPRLQQAWVLGSWSVCLCLLRHGGRGCGECYTRKQIALALLPPIQTVTS